MLHLHRNPERIYPATDGRGGDTEDKG
jgi:hypothetical protein